MTKKTNVKKVAVKKGDIVYLSRHYAEWIKMLKGDLDISLIHRIARVVKIIDWSTKEGKLLLDQRTQTGKWNNLKSKDFKYILKVYYPDLKSKKTDEVGISAYEVLPLYFPETKMPLFEVYPKHLLDDMNNENMVDPFRLEKKEG